MTDGKSSSIKAWRCIGCGRIEAPQPCIGVCEDRAVELIDAGDHDRALAAARHRIERLESLVRQLAWTEPHDDQWQQCYLGLQRRARRLLSTPAETLLD